jgi:hypothetical protein
MGLPGLLFFYRERLREQGVEELFAGLGIAVAVALLFAVTVASQSVASSAGAVNRALIGPATLQLRARGPEGIAEDILGRVEDLKGVQHAAPLLEEDATIVAGSGASVSVNLAGTDVSLAVLDGLVHTLPISIGTRSRPSQWCRSSFAGRRPDCGLTRCSEPKALERSRKRAQRSCLLNAYKRSLVCHIA